MTTLPGWRTTVTFPETATGTSVAPAEESVMFPFRAPAVAVDAMRANRGPPDWAMVAVGPHVELFEETSKPVGAVALMEAERLLP